MRKSALLLLGFSMYASCHAEKKCITIGALWQEMKTMSTDDIRTEIKNNREVYRSLGVGSLLIVIGSGVGTLSIDNTVLMAGCLTMASGIFYRLYKARKNDEITINIEKNRHF